MSPATSSVWWFQNKLVEADFNFQIPWSAIETGHWLAGCQCGSEDVHEEPADRHARLDPCEPSTYRHASQCEHRSTSDRSFLLAILKVRDGAGRPLLVGGMWPL
jgi:hypothetical protein